MVTVAIAGLGARGGYTYSAFQDINPQLMKITALADVRSDVVEKYKSKFGVPRDKCFRSAEELFAAPRLADAVIIATQDRDHYKHTLSAIEKGYDILLEKPISPVPEECEELERRAKEAGVLLVVCHVLRYTAYYRKLKELLSDGVIGKLQGIEHNENVAYWHYAHSFVRGNWHSSKETSPIILQKCCHDTDILTWLADSEPESVSSVGELKYFVKDNAPKGAPERCGDNCPIADTCPYNAQKFYIESYEKSTENHRKVYWIYNAVTHNDPTYENMLKAVNETDYGKCVYKCDNDVADHQVTVIKYRNGVTATLTMSAFTKECFRTTRFFGSDGEIVSDDLSGIITVKPFKGIIETIDTTRIAKDLSGHLGGDNAMMEEFMRCVEKRNSDKRANMGEEYAVTGHMICFAAEESRLCGGKPVKI